MQGFGFTCGAGTWHSPCKQSSPAVDNQRFCHFQTQYLREKQQGWSGKKMPRISQNLFKDNSFKNVEQRRAVGDAQGNQQGGWFLKCRKKSHKVPLKPGYKLQIQELT